MVVLMTMTIYLTAAWSVKQPLALRVVLVEMAPGPDGKDIVSLEYEARNTSSFGIHVDQLSAAEVNPSLPMPPSTSNAGVDDKMPVFLKGGQKHRGTILLAATETYPKKIALEYHWDPSSERWLRPLLNLMRKAKNTSGRESAAHGERFVPGPMLQLDVPPQRRPEPLSLK